MLASILSGSNGGVGDAAARLGLARSYLSAILHDHRRPTQSTIVRKKWRKILALYYADGWAAYRELFEEKTRHLPPYKGPSPKPRKEESFGRLLWKILGGTTIDIQDAANRLSVKSSRLRRIIQGRSTPTQAMIKEKKMARGVGQILQQWLAMSRCYV